MPQPERVWEWAHVFHVTGSDEPHYTHYDGGIRPCHPPHDIIAAPHIHDGRVFVGPEHEPLKESE